MIENIKKYIDKASFIAHVNLRLQQNEHMIIDSFISNKCNLKCKHCYFGTSQSISEEIPLDVWIDIINEAIDLNIKHFHFSGKESFLDDRVFQVLDVLSRNGENRNLFYGIVSNGTSVDIEKYNEVLDTNISYLEISLEGSKKNNDMIRGEGVYDRVYNLIKNIKNKNKINITSTMFGDNNADLLSMITTLWKLGVNKFNFAPILYFSPFEIKAQKTLSCEKLFEFVLMCQDLIYNDNSSNPIDIRICMTKEMAYELFVNENILSDLIRKYVYDGYKMMLKKDDKIIEFSYPLLSIPFLNELVITHDGYIISCADDIHYKYVNKMALPNVNIMKDSFADVLHARTNFIIEFIETKLS